MRTAIAVIVACGLLASFASAQQQAAKQPDTKQNNDERCEFRLGELVCAIRQEVSPAIEAIPPALDSAERAVKDAGKAVRRGISDLARRVDEAVSDGRCDDAERMATEGGDAALARQAKDSCRPRR